MLSIIYELVCGKLGFTTIRGFAFVTDARRYAIVVKVFVIATDAVGFVGGNGFDLCRSILFMLLYNFTQQLLIVLVSGRCHRRCHYAAGVIYRAMILIAQCRLAVLSAKPGVGVG